MSEPSAPNEVLITRIFDAPRENVFKAWTDPDEVAAWYGPEQFDTPREKVRIDLRVGGRYELTMVQRDNGERVPDRLRHRRARRAGAARPALGSDAARSACTSRPSRAWSSTTTAPRRA